MEFPIGNFVSERRNSIGAEIEFCFRGGEKTELGPGQGRVHGRGREAGKEQGRPLRVQDLVSPWLRDACTSPAAEGRPASADGRRLGLFRQAGLVPCWMGTRQHRRTGSTAEQPGQHERAPEDACTRVTASQAAGDPTRIFGHGSKVEASGHLPARARNSAPRKSVLTCAVRPVPGALSSLSVL